MQINKGDKLRTITLFKATGLIHYSAPVTGSFECEIPLGTFFEVVSEPRDGYPGFYVMPENQEYFEKQFVPPNERKSKLYGGYSFVFMTSDIGEKFELHKDE